MVAGKLVESLLGVEREEGATALFWGTWMKDAKEIVMMRGLNDNNVRPHWILDVSTIIPNRNNKNS